MLLGRFIGDLVRIYVRTFLVTFHMYIYIYIMLVYVVPMFHENHDGRSACRLQWPETVGDFLGGPSQAQATFMLMGKFIPGNEADLVPWQWRIRMRVAPKFQPMKRSESPRRAANWTPEK